LGKVNILIVEDELIIAEDLKDILQSLGYEVCGLAISAREAMVHIEEHAPDLALLDIQLKGGKDGIDLAEDIKPQFKLPFIFLTSHADSHTLDRAKKVHPYGYLVKPFQEKDIHAAVEIALSNFARESNNQNHQAHEATFVLNDSFFIRAGGMLVKLRFNDIIYLEADANYTNVYTREKRFVVRSVLKELEQKLVNYNFSRIHKSYVINLDAIDAIDSEAVHIGAKEIPISRSQHSWLLSHIKTL
jgi:DNA-binding LytR/AlgR family response regulator